MPHHKLATFLKEKPLTQDAFVSLDKAHIPQISLIKGREKDTLSQKEQEACNLATD